MRSRRFGVAVLVTLVSYLASPALPSGTYTIDLECGTDGASNNDGSAQLCADDGNTAYCTLPGGSGSIMGTFPAGDGITVSVTETVDGACWDIGAGQPGEEDFQYIGGYVNGDVNTSVTFTMPAQTVGEHAKYACSN